MGSEEHKQQIAKARHQEIRGLIKLFRGLVMVVAVWIRENPYVGNALVGAIGAYCFVDGAFSHSEANRNKKRFRKQIEGSEWAR